MLTYSDEPTIRFAMMRRLDKEPGVKICEIKTVPHLRDDPPYIAVGVLATVMDAIVTRSIFELPAQFELRHLHNEIDEIAEQFKAARLDFFGKGCFLLEPEKQLAGSGLRGRWKQYG